MKEDGRIKETKERHMKFIIEHLSKSFEKKEVLRDIHFTFEEGKIYGLLGRNVPIYKQQI